MKLRTSPLFLAAALVLPCCAALFNMGVISGIVFGVSLGVSILLLIAAVFHRSNIRKAYPGISAIYDGCVLIETYKRSIVFHIIAFVLLITLLKMTVAASIVFILTAYAAGLLLIIGGSARILIKSTQLSLTSRLLIIFLFYIPVVRYFVLRCAAKRAWQEFDRESARYDVNNARAENEICKTKYPILLVHGIFFRDLNFFNYWGRVPRELIKNGAQIYYGDQPSAASVAECGEFIADRIEDIISMTGCGKVNIIAHSKGGLDSRYAASLPRMNGCIASITTVNTPHRGCRYADFLIEKLPPAVLSGIAAKYNGALSRFGEKSDFIKGVTDLTAKNCAEFNDAVSIPQSIYCQSVGTYMRSPRSAGFPLNFVHILAKLFSQSENDGLVDLESMRWGKEFTVFEPKTARGISHGDVIDLLREDVSGFDVREAYVKIVEGLKMKGL